LARKPMYFRPCVEGFEERVVPAAVLGPAKVAAAAPAALNLSGLLNITGVQLTNLQVVNGVLQGAGTITGTLAGLPFTATISSFTLTPNPQAGQCAILSLHLDPIHLSLLGLHVDTSPICLDITANHGGGVLGDLLCGLSDNLSGLVADPTALQNLIGQVLSGALNSPKAAHGHGHAHAQAASDVCTGQTEVLDLTLGPVNLNLLGLHVSLDNCTGGPVQVCVSATASEGLLGSVLSSLSNAHLSLADITRLIGLFTP
ncbi:MAG: hypothetical protein ACJ8F7_11350, partial [Gemmataceae bacterium]